MSVNSYGFLFRFVGFVIIQIALTKLVEYNKSFRIPLIASGMMIVCSLYSCISGISVLLYDEMLIERAIFSSEEARHALGEFDMALEFFFTASLAFAIRAIARETEEEKIAFAAIRNFVFFCVYYALYGIALLPFDFREDYVKYFSLPVVLLYFGCIILNLILIFKCYMRICDEADVDMARKPSRFAFVNKLREESDRREQRAIDRSREYADQKRQKKENKKNRRK